MISSFAGYVELSAKDKINKNKISVKYTPNIGFFFYFSSIRENNICMYVCMWAVEQNRENLSNACSLKWEFPLMPAYAMYIYIYMQVTVNLVLVFLLSMLLFELT